MPYQGFRPSRRARQNAAMRRDPRQSLQPCILSEDSRGRDSSYPFPSSRSCRRRWQGGTQPRADVVRGPSDAFADARQVFLVAGDSPWERAFWPSEPGVPVKREWDRCGAAKLGLRPSFRAGTCGTGGEGARGFHMFGWQKAVGGRRTTYARADGTCVPTMGIPELHRSAGDST